MRFQKEEGKQQRNNCHGRNTVYRERNIDLHAPVMLLIIHHVPPKISKNRTSRGDVKENSYPPLFLNLLPTTSLVFKFKSILTFLMDHPESPSMEPSLLFHSSPRLLEDFNRWNNNTTPDHSRLAVEAWVPFNSPSTSYSPPMIAPSTSYSSPTSNSSELYLQPAFRAYSPLLNSPLSPTDTFQLLPAMNYLQGSPVHFTPAPTSTYSHHSDEASHYSDEASHYSDDGSNQRWTKNHSYNSPPQSSPTRSKVFI